MFSSTSLLPQRQKLLYLDLQALLDAVMKNIEENKDGSNFETFKETWKQMNFSQIHLSLINFNNDQ